MRRLGVAAIAVCVIGGATTAEAAVTKGTYKGSVKGQGSITIKVDSKKRLIQFVRTNMTLECDDGSEASYEKTESTGKVAVKSDGTFVWKAPPADRENGYTWRLAGTINSPRASGTLAETARFSAGAQKQPDPNGAVTCTTGKLKWSAKRQ
jgi:hypothetical protein